MPNNHVINIVRSWICFFQIIIFLIKKRKSKLKIRTFSKKRFFVIDFIFTHRSNFLNHKNQRRNANQWTKLHFITNRKRHECTHKVPTRQNETLCVQCIKEMKNECLKPTALNLDNLIVERCGVKLSFLLCCCCQCAMTLQDSPVENLHLRGFKYYSAKFSPLPFSYIPTRQSWTNFCCTWTCGSSHFYSAAQVYLLRSTTSLYKDPVSYLRACILCCIGSSKNASWIQYICFYLFSFYSGT